MPGADVAYCDGLQLHLSDSRDTAPGDDTRLEGSCSGSELVCRRQFAP
jgi:hypothetical protein